MNVNPNYIQQLTAALSQSTAQLQVLSSQISSGVRLTGVGDDPVAAAQNVQFSAQIAADSTFTQTAATTTARMQVADSTLGSVVDQINQAISVATAGNNGTNNASDQSSVAAELTSIRDEILGLANTAYGGNYLFSGSQNSSPPFQLDTSTTPASVVYSGDNVVNHLNTPGGQSIATNLPGQQIFTVAGGDLLGTLNSLIQGFSTGDTATTTALTSQLTAALSQVSTQRASLDGAINRFQSASSYASQEKTQLVANQTNLLQADLPTVATKLSANETQQSASNL
jgi:flagellar hook-associated protein 3 FlgL